MKYLHRILPLALAALLTGLAIGRGGPRSGQAPTLPTASVGDGATAILELGQVALRAREHLGREIRFTLQVESLPATWNPYVTRFGTEDYRAVTAWGDEQNLWDPEQYGSPAATVFVRRGSAADDALGQAGRYARFDAVGIVRQVFLGRPWIEVTALAPLKEQFGEGSMIHAARGVELMAAEHWVLAGQSFDRALASDLPARARAELEGLRNLCLARTPQKILIPKRRES
jgi:hypothetical protein